ncbi:MAG: PTS system mannose/fructose/sorbose family transporter subunit IID [Peptoniphilaceae bacterium]|nr:PTS system mannose/fructose/sorbose family transporter subunit IID [Peptoniphilaceae bacterium]MDD7383948.1 PTS system mannose/fructose/sorbose family transporter subunit IID [Peptoniphilaceae bacterium]MDY3738091.1 PTS system mannose/fructose/sorbose family transporter subunit IID [Peptoniphilaceae bacterium]
MASKNEYIIPDRYEDLTPAPQLDKKTLNKMVWRSLFLQASFNYERMQAAGWLYGILPGLEKIHTNKKDLAASMSHNLEFFNTHPFLVTFVMGIILSLEQNKADIQTIRAVRVAAMGPLGGIGDALFWFTLVPIVAGLTSNMAIDGNIIAPFLFLLIFNIAQFAIRFWLMNWSYNLGQDAIGILTENAKEFTRAASILGIFVVGALTANYGATSVAIDIPNGQTAAAYPIVTVVDEAGLKDFEDQLYVKGDDGKFVEENGEKKLADGASVKELANGKFEVKYNENTENPVTINVQKILDGILPKIIPLALTLMLYFLMVKKGFTPVKGIGLLLLIALLGYVIELIAQGLGAGWFKFWP